MKKIIVLIYLILILFLNIDARRASWRYTWTNTVINIPLGEAIEKYKYLPKATLYKDSIALTDANITYLRDGDWLYYLSDVNTKKVGTYYVWYKAFENEKYKPGTCNDYKCKIEFNVIDNIAPEVNVLNNSLNIRARTDYDLLNNITARDNYYDELNYRIDTNLNINNPGSYYAKIFVSDGANNLSEVSFSINVFDDFIPTIEKIKSEPLRFEIGSNINLSDYFRAYDDVDLDISNKIIYPSVTTDEVGVKSYTLKVYDSAGNLGSLDIDIEIYDLSKPEIILYNDSIILDYNTNFKNYDFLKYIKEIKDNEAINYDKLTIETDLENEVGNYNVSYIYNDGTYETKKNLNVNLVSFSKPIIKTETISVLEGEYANLANYISVYDESDPNVLDSLIIYDDEVNYYKAGRYFAEAYAINSSGISNTKSVEVRVLNNKDYNRYLGNDSSDFFNFKDLIYIAILIILIVIFSVVLILLKRKKKI